MIRTLDDKDVVRAADLVSAIRALPKYGFHVIHDPDAAASPRTMRSDQALNAACLLLGVQATDKALAHDAVLNLAAGLLDNADAATRRIGDKATGIVPGRLAPAADATELERPPATRATASDGRRARRPTRIIWTALTLFVAAAIIGYGLIWVLDPGLADKIKWVAVLLFLSGSFAVPACSCLGNRKEA
ncbi:hypothetical protein [Burkholderia sp. Ac-20365]|uniref:hypothetical protein n=1 Tax=Burkholderia sp. Ac-20365 TaxID=2703897 RepID=UPI00197BEE45|nr:hypothetical protein [Burkholderia sp. Ac-20365]MBN3761277.1 hypothetical protein [Burkholderia sp. Ac-20365]